MCNPAIGATHFALYMAATNLTYSWTAPAGGQIADDHGYMALYLGAALIQLVSVALLWLVDPAQARAGYGATEPSGGSATA